MRRLLVMIPIALALLVTSGRSLAADGLDDGRWRDRPLAVLGHMGLGTPTGALGVTVDWSPAPWVVLSGGVGRSGSTQYALMTRVRALRWEYWGVTAGAGISGGGYAEPCLIDCAEARDRIPKYDFAVWANGEVGLEVRASWGGTMRTYFGVGTILNRDAYGCAAGSCERPTKTIGYVGIAYGYAFEL